LNIEVPRASVTKRAALTDYLDGPLAPLLQGATWFEIGATLAEPLPPDGSQDLVFAGHRLQEIGDYRAAIQDWFRILRVGGRLVIVVSHAFLYERLLALPGRWDPAQRRLYTPASLLAEVEEALVPNTYRVRWLGDDDRGYDYALDRETPPVGAGDVVLVIERIIPPAWGLAEAPTAEAAAPDYSFEPERTRVEFVSLRPRNRILILKLDHLGDFIMGMPALERARAAFPEAHITLVVGAWNLDIARQMNVADQVVPFNVFPTNSSEEEVDVRGKAALFQATITEEYDLAIDLRTDTDTRFLLKSVRAALKAGVGTRAQFPYLDIALPLDFNRNEPETAKEFNLRLRDFSSQSPALRNDFRIASTAGMAETHCAIVWGPYLRLRAGDYIFEPFIELDPLCEGVMLIDVALDTKWIARKHIPAPEGMDLKFRVDTSTALFEFRIWALEGTPQISFSFYGGRLIRRGAASVLHQSEYLCLLIELISMRLDRFGALAEGAQIS
jgi:SAM-dependent methyltransferase